MKGRGADWLFPPGPPTQNQFSQGFGEGISVTKSLQRPLGGVGGVRGLPVPRVLLPLCV